MKTAITHSATFVVAFFFGLWWADTYNRHVPPGETSKTMTAAGA